MFWRSRIGCCPKTFQYLSGGVRRPLSEKWPQTPEPFMPDGSMSKASDGVSMGAELALEKLHAGMDRCGCFDRLKHRGPLSPRAAQQPSHGSVVGRGVPRKMDQDLQRWIC